MMSTLDRTLNMIEILLILITVVATAFMIPGLLLQHRIFFSAMEILYAGGCFLLKCEEEQIRKYTFIISLIAITVAIYIAKSLVG